MWIINVQSVYMFFGTLCIYQWGFMVDVESISDTQMGIGTTFWESEPSYQLHCLWFYMFLRHLIEFRNIGGYTLIRSRIRVSLESQTIKNLYNLQIVRIPESVTRARKCFDHSSTCNWPAYWTAARMQRSSEVACCWKLS